MVNWVLKRKSLTEKAFQVSIKWIHCLLYESIQGRKIFTICQLYILLLANWHPAIRSKIEKSDQCFLTLEGECYDLDLSDVWTYLPRIPLRVRSQATEAVGEKVFVIGGYNHEVDSNRVWHQRCIFQLEHSSFYLLITGSGVWYRHKDLGWFFHLALCHAKVFQASKINFYD